MVVATNLGFGRIGIKRQLKFLVEKYWNGKVTYEELVEGAKNLRADHWKTQKDAGIADGHIPSNDFAYYDQVLDHSFMIGAIPERYQSLQLSPVDKYFAMARGCQRDNIDVPAMEMKKWYDTNYHFIVPELVENQEFKLSENVKAVDEFLEAKALGIKTRPVLQGPVTYLLQAKVKGVDASFNNLTAFIPRIVPVYVEILKRLADAGAEWVQFDESYLVMDIVNEKYTKEVIQNAFETAYKQFKQAVPSIKILIATYFDRIDSNIDFVSAISNEISGLHIDLIRAPGQLQQVIEKVKSYSNKIVLSVGVIDGRNIWKSDLNKAIKTAQVAVDALGSENVFIAPSCSLLHVPHTLTTEENIKKNNPEVYDWLAFAVEKLDEISTIAKAINNGVDSVKDKIEANQKSVNARSVSPLIHKAEVKEAVKNITPDMLTRGTPFAERIAAQQKILNLPKFPTTTIGSFPQSKEVRLTRQKFRKGEITKEEYDQFIKDETNRCIKKQEEYGLDVLVHGEFERTDMVEFFGEKMEGYIFSQFGWVQSYGSRCVKPPILYGDIVRPQPMTVEMSKFAQSCTQKPVKGMLTGPVTILQWSFVRDDQPRSTTAYQIALAIRKEVKDLEDAGIKVIQVDEAALREGLPLRKSDQANYLQWAIDTFLLATCTVKPTTQIHTHMCYSHFNEIFTSIKRMDTDAITIENSRSDLKLLNAFKQYGYTNGIGPGMYDIHSPRVPSVQEILERARATLNYISPDLLWINPDCGLKTRGWAEVEPSLNNLVEVAVTLRKEN